MPLILPMEDITRDSTCMNDMKTMRKKVISIVVTDGNIMSDYRDGGR